MRSAFSNADDLCGINAEQNRQAAPERTRQEPHKRHAPATPEGSLVDFTEEEL